MSSEIVDMNDELAAVYFENNAEVKLTIAVKEVATITLCTYYTYSDAVVTELSLRFPSFNLQLLNPNEISFSQIIVYDKKSSLSGNLERWDQQKYGINGNFILVVKFDEDCLVSYDNSRLLVMARHERIKHSEFVLPCDVRNAVDYLSNDFFYSQSIEHFEVFLSFSFSDEHSATKGVYIAQVRPLTYGMLMYLSCAQQGEDFPLHGAYELPTCQTVDQKRSGAARLTGIAKMADCKISEVFQKMKSMLLLGSHEKNDNVTGKVFIHKVPGGQMHHNNNLDVLLQTMSLDDMHTQLLVINCKYYPERWIKPSSEYDSFDRCDDDEAFEIDMQAQEETNDAWNEYLTDYFSADSSLVANNSEGNDC